MLKRGIDARDGDKDKTTPLMIAAKFGRAENILALIEHLGPVEVGVNRKNKEGNAAIHFAATFGHLECIKALIDVGKANVNLNGKDRMTALILASAAGHFEIV